MGNVWKYIKVFFKTIYKLWMKFAHFIGKVNTTIILTVVYSVVFGIFSIIARLMGKDLLDVKLSDVDSYWGKKEIKEKTKEDFLRQF